MFSVGQVVRVLAPFNEAFPDALEITDIILSDDGTKAYILGDAGGFDERYLELVA